jgi:hypothetical protein
MTCSVSGFCGLENPAVAAPTDGGACNLADNLVCLGGTCQPAPGPGQPCTPAYDCAPGSGCLLSDPPLMCVARVGEGQSCANTGCTKGLYCGTGLLCAPLKAAGEACTAPEQCVTGQCTSSDRCYSPADRWTAEACAGALPF